MNKLLLLLLLFLPSCLPFEDLNLIQAFRLKGFTPEQREVFSKAQEWWNARDAESYLTIGVNGLASASFRKLPSGVLGQFECPYVYGGCQVQFSSEHEWIPGQLCLIARHELGHFLGYGESTLEGNVMNANSEPCG